MCKFPMNPHVRLFVSICIQAWFWWSVVGVVNHISILSIFIGCWAWFWWPVTGVLFHISVLSIFVGFWAWFWWPVTGVLTHLSLILVASYWRIKSCIHSFNLWFLSLLLLLLFHKCTFGSHSCTISSENSFLLFYSLVQRKIIYKYTLYIYT